MQIIRAHMRLDILNSNYLLNAVHGYLSLSINLFTVSRRLFTAGFSHTLLTSVPLSSAIPCYEMDSRIALFVSSITSAKLALKRFLNSVFHRAFLSHHPFFTQRSTCQYQMICFIKPSIFHPMVTDEPARVAWSSTWRLTSVMLHPVALSRLVMRVVSQEARGWGDVARKRGTILRVECHYHRERNRDGSIGEHISHSAVLRFITFVPEEKRSNWLLLRYRC